MTDLERAREILALYPLEAAQYCIADALVAAVRMQEREKVAAFMLARSIATGHGDTIEDLLIELGGYLDRLAKHE